MTDDLVCSRGWRGLGFFLGVAAAGLLAHLVLTTAAWAQSGASQGSTGHADIATYRTVKEMQAFDAAHPNLPVVQAPFLPTMDFGQYQALKATAGPVVGGARQGAGQAPLPAAPPTLGSLHCNGPAENGVGGTHPPDTHAAIGASHFGLVLNTGVRFSTKALTGNCPTNATVINVSLAAFFGYATQPLFDPRIVYDLTYNRWIVSAEANPESPTVQKHFIAASVDSDPTHGFMIYPFNMASIVGTGHFWDYPQIGYDEEAIVLTGNVFTSGPEPGSGSYLGSAAVFLPKHRLYAAGLAFDFCFTTVGAPFNVGTIAPPIVLDQGPYTALATAVAASNFIRVYKFVGTSRACPTFLGSSDIATTMFVPPAAQQPGFANCTMDPADCLDTLDGRFQNAGTQFGEPGVPGGTPVRFWQIRTDTDMGFPTPFTYQINADTLTVDESCELFASGSSNDFNPSIVANQAGTIFMTWSSTDPTNAFNAQVRISGKLIGDACTVAQTGILVNQSANALTGDFDANVGHQRWGDYSAVTLDPADHTIAWGINEKVNAGAGTTIWKTYIFNMHNP